MASPTRPPTGQGPPPPPPPRDHLTDPTAPTLLTRVSWGAIFAGAVIALVIHMMLAVLGLGVGLTVFSPVDGDPLTGLGTGQLIWMVLSGLMAMFLGGWVAGRMAGIMRSLDGALHGAATWAVATVISLFMLTTILGTVLGGVTSVLGYTFQAAGTGAVAVGEVAVEQAGVAIDREDVDVDDVTAEMRQILRETDDPDLQPEVVEQRAEAAAGELVQGAAAAAMNPQRAGEELSAAFERALQVMEPTVDAADRDAVAAALAARTDMTEAEARRVVIRWEQQVEEAGRRIEATADTIAARAPRIAEDVTDALGRVALWSFFAMLLGLVAAGAGGFLGAPEHLPGVPRTRGDI